MPSMVMLTLDHENELRGMPLFVPGYGGMLAVAAVSPKSLPDQMYADFFEIVLIQQENEDGRYGIVPQGTRFRHVYQYEEELDAVERQCSRLEMAFLPTDPSILFAWTWDAPILYRFKVDLNIGIICEVQRPLDFRPVLKCNFGLNMYFTNTFVNLVSTCPWDHYAFELETLQIVQRAPNCPFAPCDITFVGTSNRQLIQLDSNGTFGKIDHYPTCLHIFTKDKEDLAVLINDTSLSLVPCSLKGRFTICATALHDGYCYTGIFDDIWQLLGISKLLLVPWAQPPIQYPLANGTFVENPFQLKMPSEPPVTIDLSVDWSQWYQTEVPHQSRYLRQSIICIEGFNYILDSVGAHVGLILHPITRRIHRVLQLVSHDALEILLTLSESNLLTWHSPYLFARESLQLATPINHKPKSLGIIPDEDDVFASVHFVYSDHWFESSKLVILGMDALVLTLNSGYLTTSDLISTLQIMPSIRRACFAPNIPLAEPRRRWLRTRYLDFVEMTYMEKVFAPQWEAKAASILLFLASIDDEEAIELVAASAHFKLHGCRRDKHLASKYLKLLPPKERTLHGKGGETLTIPLSFYEN
ncbi:hypothetical protein THRCLA_06837 [Thraustotheca clavata]|uniref:Uncharacterized protein n=1 Tax=Thraustotheca clavata TaxID=74557 RepID=A0A1V9ZIN2_9STRA|nr:hypothetical protein THRCLA_06837 [Thraustotheca clavata]